MQDSQPGSTPAHSSLLTHNAYVHKGVAAVERATKEAMADLLRSRQQEEGLYGLIFHAYMRAATTKMLQAIVQDLSQVETHDDIAIMLQSSYPEEIARISLEYDQLIAGIAEKCLAMGMTKAEAEERLSQLFHLKSKEERAPLVEIFKDVSRLEETDRRKAERDGSDGGDRMLHTGAVKRRLDYKSDEDIGHLGKRQKLM